MIKVGIECESLEDDTYGIARLVGKLLEEIARRPELEKEFAFTLYFKSKIPALSYLDAPIFKKRVIGIPSFSLYYYVLLPMRLWFDRPDVMYYTNYMLPILHRGKSLVFSAHDAYYEARSQDISLRYRMAYRIFCTWAAKHATKLMAMSEFGKQELATVYGISPDRIVVNHLGVDVPHMASVNRHGEYILFVGQAFSRRHLVETMQAFEKITPDFPTMRLIIVGPDKYRPSRIQQLQADINSRLGKERVICFEHVSDSELANLYAHAHALVYVSSREAFGLPPMEALVYGTVPVIADNALGHELFGNHAFFVRAPYTADAIAAALGAALTDTQKHAAIRSAARSFSDRFNWPAHTDRFLELVRALV
ncbi:MAG: glycosyltransferase family 1 protein [Patescibacteria group bacterium]